MSIKDNFTNFNSDLEKYCQTQSLDFSQIHLIAVSKTHAFAKIEEAYEWGQKDFAENYVQEFLEKWQENQEHYKFKIIWHFIGKLQTNKVNKIVGKVDYIHSVDSQNLVSKIDREAAKQKAIQKILIQISLDNDQQRGGIALTELDSLYQFGRASLNVQCQGFMLVPPVSEDKNFIQDCFAKVEKIFHNYKLGDKNLKFLSMGMSHDYKDAILHSANMIRIGTALFGERK